MNIIKSFILFFKWNAASLSYLMNTFKQAESAIDQMDWIEKITGVIASLLTSQSPEQVSNGESWFRLLIY